MDDRLCIRTLTELREAAETRLARARDGKDSHTNPERAATIYRAQLEIDAVEYAIDAIKGDLRYALLRYD